MRRASEWRASQVLVDSCLEAASTGVATGHFFFVRFHSRVFSRHVESVSWRHSPRGPRDRARVRTPSSSIRQKESARTPLATRQTPGRGAQSRPDAHTVRVEDAAFDVSSQRVLARKQSFDGRESLEGEGHRARARSRFERRRYLDLASLLLNSCTSLMYSPRGRGRLAYASKSRSDRSPFEEGTF